MYYTMNLHIYGTYKELSDRLTWTGIDNSKKYCNEVKRETDYMGTRYFHAHTLQHFLSVSEILTIYLMSVNIVLFIHM